MLQQNYQAYQYHSCGQYQYLIPNTPTRVRSLTRWLGIMTTYLSAVWIRELYQLVRVLLVGFVLMSQGIANGREVVLELHARRKQRVLDVGATRAALPHEATIGDTEQEALARPLAHEEEGATQQAKARDLDRRRVVVERRR